jgi:hypothetical protein
MKQIQIYCDICGDLIDDDKFHKLDVVLFPDIFRKQFIEDEMHFCSKHRIGETNINYLKWKNKVFDLVYTIFKENKFDPKIKY